MSDMGRVLLSITADTCGWHDPLGGHGSAAHVRRKYGERTYQEARNERHRNAHDNFLIELGKYGLGLRDLVANVNLFSRLDVDADGRMRFHSGNSSKGALVELRAEMDVLVVLDTCQHPLDTGPIYAPKQVNLSVLKTPVPGTYDECRNFRGESQRAFTLTERYHAGI
jgi:urea carboxylase-associated protein 2